MRVKDCKTHEILLKWDGAGCEWFCQECSREEAEANHRQAYEEAFDSDLDLEAEIDFEELENLPY